MLQTLAVYTAHSVLHGTASSSRILDVVIANRGFIDLVAELVMSKKRKLITEQSRVKDSHRQVLEARTTVYPRPF